MCGIVGFCVSNGASQFSDDLKHAITVLTHRGPDDQEVWLGDGLGLGHTRLSILDLSPNGSQPMTSKNGRYVIAYNGEIYNYIEIGKQLPDSFDKNSDTRVILEAIAHWGLETAVQKFNGMFAFALWDKEDKVLYLVRDSMGIKPLYWAKVKNGIIFGSELKVLQAFSSMSVELDDLSLYQYFSHQYIPSPGTIYKNCFKLSPGSILKMNREGIIAQTAFSPLTDDYSTIRKTEEAIDVFENLLQSSVKRHSRSDVPIAAFLSGGIDSSLLVSIMSKNQSLNTYSIGYTEQDFDESERAKKISQFLGVTHETLLLQPNDIKSCLEKIPHIYDEPFGDASCIPTYMLSSHVAKHVKVAFSGDGADELFGGYPRYFSAEKMWDKLGWLPSIARNRVSTVLEKNIDLMKYVTHPFLKNSEESVPYIQSALSHKNIYSFFHFNNYLGLPKKAFLKDAVFQEAKKFFDKMELSLKGGLKDLFLYDQKYRLPDGMLTKVDRASMASSLEVRVPFLDNEIIAFARQVPTKIMSNCEHTKPILRKLLATYLPEKLFKMPKTGFHVPLKYWLRSHYRLWVEDVLSSVSTQNEHILDMPEVRKIWKQYCDGDNAVFHQMWSAISYLQWKEANIKKMRKI